ncbi:MAG: hypothetical protein ABEI54_03785, partial [Candidatus Bipolaricaulia bacterium]
MNKKKKSVGQDPLDGVMEDFYRSDSGQEEEKESENVEETKDSGEPTPKPNKTRASDYDLAH